MSIKSKGLTYYTGHTLIDVFVVETDPQQLCKRFFSQMHKCTAYVLLQYVAGTFQPPGSLTQQRTDTAQVPGLPWAGGSLDELQNGCGVCTPSFASRTQQPHASATPQPKGHTAQPEAGSSNDSGLGSHALGVVSVCAHLWQLGLWPCCEEAATTVLSEAMHRHCAELVERWADGLGGVSLGVGEMLHLHAVQ